MMIGAVLAGASKEETGKIEQAASRFSVAAIEAGLNSVPNGLTVTGSLWFRMIRPIRSAKHDPISSPLCEWPMRKPKGAIWTGVRNSMRVRLRLQR